MIALAIETCFSECSLALSVNGTRYYKHEERRNMHVERLPQMLEEVAKEASINITDITHIVCNLGPGSFTGIRIGISFMLGLCFGTNIIPCGVSIMDAIIQKPDDIAVVRAIRNTFYIKQNGILEYVTEDELKKRADKSHNFMGWNFNDVIPGCKDDLGPDANLILDAFLKDPAKYENVIEPVYLRGIFA